MTSTRTGTVVSMALAFALGSSAPGGTADAKEAVHGNLALPKQCSVFAPFEWDDGDAAAGELRRVPDTLSLGTKQAKGRDATFSEKRILDLMPYLDVKKDEAPTGKTAFVYIPFTAKETGPVTFGFGADWWYQAFLDGKPLSDTVENGNATWPPTVHDVWDAPFTYFGGFEFTKLK